MPDDMALKEFATRLRRAALPVIGVIQSQNFRLDLRTVFPEQDKALTQSIQTIFQ